VNLYTLPVRRPVATAMFFAGVLVLGLFALRRIPVELLPAVSGDSLYISFIRAGSEPEVVEREMLLPLESRVGLLSGVEETWADVRGSGGSLQVRFEQGTDLKVREIELRRLAAEVVRDQPRGSTIDVQSQDTAALSRFAMFVQVTGLEDRPTLLDFVDEHVVPRLAAVPGAARVLAIGAGSREVGVRIDPERAAALGVKPEAVVAALDRSVRRLRFVGGVEDEAGRSSVVLDGRPRGLISLGDLLVAPQAQVRLRHLAQVTMGTAHEEILFRVNGRPTVGLVLFQEEGANLVRLGIDLRQRLTELRQEFGEYGLDFVINFDAAKLVQDQLERLEHLAATGFLIALVVLYLFLRQWRAVGVVAVAVPASLLAALALLYVAGQSLNLITLFGLAVGIGMLVDHSIVVFEAVQRQLERGADPDAASERGVRRTLRAILASISANAIVFLPILFTDFENAGIRSVLLIMALAILLPLGASVLVAVGLVPLLARRLTAPAVVALLADRRARREATGGLSPPDRVKELFTGLLAVALRRPAAWVTAVVAAVLFTVLVALPWVAFGSANREAAEADVVRFNVEFSSEGSLERATGPFERMERGALGLDGVKYVESMVREEGGALTVHLKPKDQRPAELNAGRVREAVRASLGELDQWVKLRASDSTLGGGGGDEDDRGGMGQILGQAAEATVLSGPDARTLDSLARDVQEQLQGISAVESAAVEGRAGQPEVRVIPDELALTQFGLTADEVLPALLVARREGVTLRTGFVEPDGREIPMTVRRTGDEDRRRGMSDLRGLRVTTSAGVLPFGALFAVRQMPPPPPIRHHDGRREVRVTYRLGTGAPATGPAREALESQIRQAIQRVHRPAGYTIDAPAAGQSFNWFKRILLPVVALLFAVLAFTFESLTLPLLVLAALPLTILGATWALVVSGTPADYMALVGTLTLIGITVNPAILLVDRMQQHAWRGGMSAGAAALSAVRERARPVLMTMTTAVAGLWPLALVSGRERDLAAVRHGDDRRPGHLDAVDAAVHPGGLRVPAPARSAVRPARTVDRARLVGRHRGHGHAALRLRGHRVLDLADPVHAARRRAAARSRGVALPPAGAARAAHRGRSARGGRALSVQDLRAARPARPRLARARALRRHGAPARRTRVRHARRRLPRRVAGLRAVRRSVPGLRADHRVLARDLRLRLGDPGDGRDAPGARLARTHRRAGSHHARRPGELDRRGPAVGRVRLDGGSLP
jgi:multidrug efflux pump subunit AcrB